MASHSHKLPRKVSWSAENSVWNDGCLLTSIFQYLSGDMFLCRQISKISKICADMAIRRLFFNPMTPHEILQAMINNNANVEIIILDRSRTVDDQIAISIMKTCTKLRYLGLSYCSQLTKDILNYKPQNLVINIHGCWRIIKPHPNMSPFGVVELQLLAFQENPPSSSEAIRIAFEFTSPSQRNGISESQLTLSSLNPNFQRLLNAESFKICRMWQKLDSCFVLVSVLPHHDRPARFYVWLLSKQKNKENKDCWMNDRIISVTTSTLE